jgi:hypothetical protein
LIGQANGLAMQFIVIASVIKGYPKTRANDELITLVDSHIALVEESVNVFPQG